MSKEREHFEKIRNKFCSEEQGVKVGKMMSSDAILLGDKVFAFLSKKDKMVFKLGKNYDIREFDFEVSPFNPFKKKGPLAGWFEVPYQHFDRWESLTQLSLEIMKE
ncbi:MAG: hypothetical protein JXR03_02600 [Cyclobacteriaceae bacterium]